MPAFVGRHVRDGKATGKWRARFQLPDGRWRTATFDTRAGGKAWLVEQQAAVSAGTYVDPTKARRTVGQFLESGAMSEVHLKPTTIDRANGIVKLYLLPVWGDVPFQKITTERLQGWINGLSKGSLSPTTVRHIGVQMGKILKRAETLGVLPVNPMKDVHLPKARREEMRFIGPESLMLLSHEVDSRYTAMVLVAGYTGLRLAELVALRRQSVVVEEGRTRIRVVESAPMVAGRAVWAEPKTKAARRTVPVPAGIAGTLDMHMMVYSSEELVFPAPKGGYINQSNFGTKIWRPAAARADLTGLRFHDLRHSAISIWIANGASPKRVAQWAGHASSAFTMDRYGHLFAEDDAAFIDKLDERIFGSA
jgi:integrase